MTYDTMPAGPEMDAAIAKILGTLHDKQVQGTADPEAIFLCNGDHILAGKPYQFPKPEKNRKWYYQYDYWSPSTNIAHAWEIVERMRQRRLYANVMQGDQVAHCMFEDYDGAEISRAKELTAPLAICRAALMATKDTP